MFPKYMRELFGANMYPYLSHLNFFNSEIICGIWIAVDEQLP